ncbi:MAG TPA: response regulator transcription factor [Steroidobacteraceae bacterium]|jgi:DNA-binding NarL/FixJ family response regulator|nr:response regulator transcription factor [Steroidobacteraceae bacterium]
MTHTVLIVDDDLRLRAAFAQAVRVAADLKLIGEADDLPEGLRLLETMQPDVLLVDIGLPSGSGLALIRHAAKRTPQCNVMVITVFAEEQLVVDCIEAGATGYLLKGSSPQDIAAQIRQLVAGGSPISPTIARRLLGRFTNSRNTADSPAAGNSPTLSTQEQAVLSMSAKGYSYDEIAPLLKLSRHTVETYVKRIYRKLQVHSKTAAVYEARKLGLVDD